MSYERVQSFLTPVDSPHLLVIVLPNLAIPLEPQPFMHENEYNNGSKHSCSQRISTEAIAVFDKECVT